MPDRYQIERDRFGLMYSGPDVHVGEMREVYEAKAVDVERDRLLDVLQSVHDADTLGAVEQGEAIEAVEAVLRQHGRLSGGEGE